VKLKFAVLVIGHQFANPRRKRARFDDRHGFGAYANGV